MRKEKRPSNTINIASLAISVFALLVAGGALGFSFFAYYQTTKPESDRVRVSDQIERAYNRLSETEALLNSADVTQDLITQFTRELVEIKASMRQAEGLWMNGKYAEAEDLVREAYTATSGVQSKLMAPPLPPPPPSRTWIYIVVMIVAVVVVGLIAWRVVLRRPKAPPVPPAPAAPPAPKP